VSKSSQIALALSCHLSLPRGSPTTSCIRLYAEGFPLLTFIHCSQSLLINQVTSIYLCTTYTRLASSSTNTFLSFRYLYTFAFVEFILRIADNMFGNVFPRKYNGKLTLDDLLWAKEKENARLLKSCLKSATFLSHLSRPAIEGVYWSMIIAIVMLAMASGVVYSKFEQEHRYSSSPVPLQ
jgi:hypothetical protein